MFLEINGQRVEVDDSFDQLSPEQQNATVDEIARELGIASQKPAEAVPAQEQQPKEPYTWKDGLELANDVIALVNPMHMGHRAGRMIADALPGIAKSGAAAVSAPVRAMSGQLQIYDNAGNISPQVIEEATNMALWASPTAAGTLKGGAALANAAKKAVPEGKAVTDAANRLGVEVPRSYTSDSKIVQSTGKALENQPLAGGPLLRANEKAVQQLDNAAARIQSEYGTGSVSNAGSLVRDSITDYAKNVLKGRVSEKYDAVDKLVTQNVTTPLSNTAKVALDITSVRQNAALPGDSTAVKLVQDAVNRQGGLNYQGIKQLRSYIGEMLENPSLVPAGTSQAELKRIYGALTDDLQEAVKRSGGEKAFKAFKEANDFAAKVAKDRESLQKILGTTKSDEALFDTIQKMAGTSTRADLNRLALARKAVDRETWDEVASAVIARMGRDADGNFSPERFITARSRLSPFGKAMLFNTTGKKGLSKALDDIEAVSRRITEVNKKYGNPSGTARNAGFVAAGAGLVTSPIKTVSAVLGGNLVARYLAKPETAKAIADYAKAAEMAATKPSLATNELLASRANHLARIAAADMGNLSLADDLTAQLLFKGKTEDSDQDHSPVGADEGDQQPNNERWEL